MPTWAIVLGLVALALAGYLLVRSRNASAASNTSGNPGPDLTGSAAQQPNGGASNSPGQFPDNLVSHPDTLQQQVQQADASSPEAPTTTYSYVNPQPGQTSPAYVQTPGGGYLQQVTPGSDYYLGLPPSHPGVGGATQLPDVLAGSVTRPGFQPDI